MFRRVDQAGGGGWLYDRLAVDKARRYRLSNRLAGIVSLPALPSSARHAGGTSKLQLSGA
ncbi:hypothetical protein F0Q45_20220 [Mycobacterium simiae]|uniref:Uncharacterized protein n=1 Tax=Mycobacterium simiae TaxID=1784 RepID=A0A5B1BLZ8_MYCSI|nr:hypothetical protein [Mycobacterium simiae]KAA1248490.1 hypothetical protein F0Q45_20220 [Mycobacterium simiae]